MFWLSISPRTRPGPRKNAKCRLLFLFSCLFLHAIPAHAVKFSPVIQELNTQMRRCGIPDTQAAMDKAMHAGEDMTQVLHAACKPSSRCSHPTDMIRLLIEYGGVDVNATVTDLITGVESSLLLACAQGKNAEVIDYLLENGANAEPVPNHLKDKWKRILLFGKEVADKLEESEKDGRQEEETRTASTEEPELPFLSPEQGEEQVVPPGRYTFPCRSESNNPPGSVTPGETGYHEVMYTVVFPPNFDPITGVIKTGVPLYLHNRALHASVPSKGCRPFLLKDKSRYTIYTETIHNAWVWECPNGGSKCIRATKKNTRNDIKRAGTNVTVSASAKPNPKRESGLVRIMDPVAGDQFSFDDTQPDGVLVFSAMAKYSGDNTTVEFSMDKVGGAKPQIIPISNPPKGTAKATIKVTGLPNTNGEFGPVTITAKGDVAGSDSVKIDVFFDPKARNHPAYGRGGEFGTAPNWFYYWSQTRARGGRNVTYIPKLPSCADPTRSVQGRYDHKQDKLLIADAVVSGPCVKRVRGAPNAGQQSEGIDCFAEVIRHESVHEKEFNKWWNKHGVRLPACGLDDITGTLLRKFSGLDSDLDMVPDEVERSLSSRGCDPDNPKSCLGRPRADLLDVEMNAYTEAWNQWPIGTADGEDWSQCGKQWKNRSLCR